MLDTKDGDPEGPDADRALRRTQCIENISTHKGYRDKSGINGQFEQETLSEEAQALAFKESQRLCRRRVL